jgi:hypothetical protein
MDLKARLDVSRKGIPISCQMSIWFKVTEQRSGLLTGPGLFHVFS